MNLRWLIGNYADPEFKLTRRQQHEVTWLAHRKYLAKRKLLMWTLGMTFAGWALMAVGWNLGAGVLARLGVRAALPVSVVTMCIVVVVVAAWLYRFIYVKPVRLAMRELGYDVCVGCGYRLQGLTDDIARCPECGQPREALSKNTATTANPPAEPGANG